MEAAIFGLVGVVIGGLLQGGFSLVFANRQMKTKAKAAARLLTPIYRDAKYLPTREASSQLLGVLTDWT